MGCPAECLMCEIENPKSHIPVVCAWGAFIVFCMWRGMVSARKEL